jgi:hypothetical protein
MIISNHINIKMLRTVARRLGPLRERVVFLGGCATYLLITDTAIPEIRPTLDVDVIVEIVSRLEYYKLEKKLQELGFAHSFGSNGSKDPICRWEIEGVTVDIITVIDGRPEMINEIKISPSDIRKYLSQRFRQLSNNEFFIESLSGHLRPDKASQARLPLLIERVKMIAASD